MSDNRVPVTKQEFDSKILGLSRSIRKYVFRLSAIGYLLIVFNMYLVFFIMEFYDGWWVSPTLAILLFLSFLDLVGSSILIFAVTVDSDKPHVKYARNRITERYKVGE
jgi:hypothetical protein